MILWRPQDNEYRRWFDIFFLVLGAIVLIVGAVSFLNFGDEGPQVETVGFTFPAALPTTTSPPTVATTTATTTAPTTRPRATTTVAPSSTTLAPTTTTRPRVATTTTVTLPPVTVPPPTTPPPTTTPDSRGPTISSLRSSPSKLFEAPCTGDARLSVTITDASGVASATMFGSGMSRQSGTNDWFLVRAMPSGAVPTGRASISLPVTITARDARGNSSSVSSQFTIHDCA